MNNYFKNYHTNRELVGDNMRRRRIKRRKQKKIIIISTLSLLLFITIGYAAFSTNLSLKAKGNIQPRNNLYVSSNGSDTTGNGTKEKPYLTVQKAYDSAWENATIWIMDNITIDETIEFNQDKNITLTSEENEINSLLRGEEEERLMQITSGETTFTNITLDGQNKEALYSLIRIVDSTVNLNSGTTFQNQISLNDGGGAITLSLNVIMNINGAKIINNKALGGGGGAIISRHSTLTINDCEISGNEARNGGAILFGDLEGILTMNGGIIKNNTATVSFGGGIYVAGANMIMTGGEISDNYSQTYGGGIVVAPVANYDNLSTLTMNGGTIKNNTADADGGGIYILKNHSYKYIKGTITDNTPNNIVDEN